MKRELVRKLRGIRMRVNFWLAKRLKNGVIYMNGETTLVEAFDKVRKGGYIVLGNKNYKVRN